MVDLGITFPEGEIDPGVDVILPDLRFIEEQRSQPARARAHARARGPHRRGDRAVAAAAECRSMRRRSPPACCRRSSPSTARAEAADQRGGARRALQGRAVRPRAHHARALDPRARRRSPSARRLARCSTPATGRSTRRRWSARPPTKRSSRRWATKGVLAMMCDSTNALREGRSPSEDDVAARWPTSSRAPSGASPSRLCLQRRAHQGRGAMPRARRPPARGGGARHASRHPGRDRHRLSAAGFRVPRPGALRLPRAAARSCCCARAARASRAPRWPASPRTSIPTSRSTQGDLVIFSSRTIPGNEKAVGRIQNGLAASAATSSPTATRWCT